MVGGVDAPGRGIAAFFNPRRIAVIGASANATKIGGRPIRNLQLGGFQGEILPINPGRSEVQGLASYPTLGAAGGHIDLAIIAVPAAQVTEQVQACVDARVSSAIIFSSGFAETGEDGHNQQSEITRIAKQGGLRLLGPNCMGVINTHAGVLATFTSGILENAPTPGRISLASQSGAFASHCLTLMRERGLALSLWATTGNQADVEVADFLEHMAEDPMTDVVIGSIEGVEDATTLIRAFERARVNRKPMVVMKVGRSVVGADAVASHTASLAGSDAVFDAVLRQYGVHRAHTIDELLDIAYACSLGRYPLNDRLGVVTVSGGVGVLIADAAEDVGLDVAPLPADIQDRMRELVPFAATRNPLDVTAQILNDPALIEPMFELLMAQGGYDAAITFLSHLGMNPAVIASLMPGLERVAARYPDQYLCVCIIAHPDVKSRLEAMGYAVFEDPTRAVQAVAALHRFRISFDAPSSQIQSSIGPATLERGAVYSEHEAKELLRAAGIPSPQEAVVQSSESAAAAASEIGFPVVMKIVSPDILHKSDIGGVILGVADAGQAAAAFATLRERASQAQPDARIEGVLVAPMVRGGVEVVLGVASDPVFGPVVMFGLGGVFVEVLKDVVFRRAPFSVAEAEIMISEIRGAAMLDGVRGAPAADKKALAETLSKLSLFAAANADALESADINPVVVLAEGSGVVALDALINTRSGDLP